MEQGSRKIVRETSEREEKGQVRGRVGQIGRRRVIINLAKTGENKWMIWGDVWQTRYICLYRS